LTLIRDDPLLTQWSNDVWREPNRGSHPDARRGTSGGPFISASASIICAICARTKRVSATWTVSHVSLYKGGHSVGTRPLNAAYLLGFSGITGLNNRSTTAQRGGNRIALWSHGAARRLPAVRRLPHTSPLISWKAPVFGSLEIMQARQFWPRNDRTTRQAWQL
jgi:hypothetical protein